MTFTPGMVIFYIDVYWFQLTAVHNCNVIIVYCPACLDFDQDVDTFDVYTNQPTDTSTSSSLRRVVIE